MRRLLVRGTVRVLRAAALAAAFARSEALRTEVWAVSGRPKLPFLAVRIKRLPGGRLAGRFLGGSEPYFGRPGRRLGCRRMGRPRGLRCRGMGLGCGGVGLRACGGTQVAADG